LEDLKSRPDDHVNLQEKLAEVGFYCDAYPARIERNHLRGTIVPLKYSFVALLSLFAVNSAFAGEPDIAPHQQLQQIIDLFQDDRSEDAAAQLELAEDELIAAVRASGDADAFTLLGRAYFYAERDAKAIEAFEAALRLDPSLSRAHFFIGLVHRYAGDLESAALSFRRAIALDDTDQDAFVELGRTLESTGDLVAASEAYKNALAIDERNLDANFHLATIYGELGDASGAEKHYLAVVEQIPDDVDTNYNLGQLYQNTGQHDLAIKRFEKVVEQDPTEWRAIAKLVQENEAIGDIDARDAAIEKIYTVWRSNVSEELSEQRLYIREQRQLDNDKLFVLEYFELKGERAKKVVFKLQDEQSGDIRFEVSLGSYDATTEFARATGSVGPDERVFHLDGYAPNGSHYTYAFFNSMPKYEVIKEMALKAFAGEQDVVSSTVIPE
jgi:tetratricopeptide (TPR) repeat protein